MLSLLNRYKTLSFRNTLILVFAVGAFASLAVPPLNLFPFMIVGLSALYIFTTTAPTPLAAFCVGFMFAFGYHIFGLYWIGNALLVEGNAYIWAWPLAVIGLPALLALFSAFACLLARHFSNGFTAFGFLAFAAWVGFFEFARSFAFTGFPWNLYGHTWAGLLPVLQVLSFSDVYWLSALTIIWCALPGYWLIGRSPIQNKIAMSALFLALFIASVAFGITRLSTPAPAAPAANVHLVQANIPQSEKWNSEKMWDHLVVRLNLSRPDMGARTDLPTYIIWPETALSERLFEEPRTTAVIDEVLAQYTAPVYLVTGFLREYPQAKRFYNSMIMIEPRKTVSNVYDKKHLVPFGEYIPYQKWIPLEPVTKFSGFTGGVGPLSLQSPDNLLYSPMICYEIIFSGRVVDPLDRPDFIINITNDSWYGKTAGPHQHMSQAVFRAIEEGLPVVRVADTGISGVIDPYGRVIEKSDVFVEYEKTVALPGKIMLSRADAIYRHISLLILFFGVIISGFLYKKYNR
jgi:apolipoprotein N-acyltransferase